MTCIEKTLNSIFNFKIREDQTRQRYTAEMDTNTKISPSLWMLEKSNKKILQMIENPDYLTEEVKAAQDYIKK